MNRCLNISSLRCFAHFFFSSFDTWYCISSVAEHFFVHIVLVQIFFLDVSFSFIFLWDKHDAGNFSFSQDILKFHHLLCKNTKQQGMVNVSAQLSRLR